MLNWINNRYSINISAKDIINLTEFTLVWNIFDKDVCNCSANYKIITIEINKKKFDDLNIMCEYQFFLNRYTTNNATNEFFEKLKFRKAENKFKLIAKSILENEKCTKKEKIIACSYIILRLRNNLFHGIKDMAGIEEHDNTFYFANQILKKVIGKYAVRKEC